MMIQQKNLLDQVFDYANRANPYPIYEKMREHPVIVQDDGRYIVSSYAEISALLQDPRMSVDMRKSYSQTEHPILIEGREPSFVRLDPPEHDWQRHQVISKFTPELIVGLRPRIEEVVKGLLDARRQEREIDLVDNFAYPLPVTIICEILGVPREDEPFFHAWTDKLIRGFDVGQRGNPEARKEAEQASQQLHDYMGGLISKVQQQPGPGLLSAILHDETQEKRMDKEVMITTSVLLLVAGHETTVNLIDNTMLTLLRNPQSLEKLRREPALIANLLEEVLRYEPPVQFVPRTSLTEMTIAGVTIPKGAPIFLMLAAGNRDPKHFAHPDRFDPERPNIEHFGFGGGIHYCVGAPLARLEAEIAVVELARRLQSPRLLQDPPPYRSSSLLRGPRHLLIGYDRLVD
ncbi:MAG TPA: cytochrome P450 [Ktedonobacteraceae bacterium]|nr:cytochrome P450 [Ktedonobacteraceae bacterium]